MPFYDPDADTALFEELEKLLNQTEIRKIVRVPHAINDPSFAKEARTAEWYTSTGGSVRNRPVPTYGSPTKAG